MDLTTSLFYELNCDDKVGHKIVSVIKTASPIELEWLRIKVKEIFAREEIFHCKIVNHSWVESAINWEKQIYKVDENVKLSDYVNENLNTLFDPQYPGWICAIVEESNIVFSFDHCYGDGAKVSNIIRHIFDDPSNNNCIPKKANTEGRLSFFAKVWLFLKVVYLVYKRYSKAIVEKDDHISEKSRHIRFGQLSLSQLKRIRDRFTCSDGSKISINDILHSLLVKTNSLYFKKGTISSAAMFNMREGKQDMDVKNKLGYILLTNKCEMDDMPEEVLRDIHDFMTFYKVTPAVPVIVKAIEWMYWLNKALARDVLIYMNSSVDFIISNYVFEFSDKTLNGGLGVENVNACVSPSHTKQMYSFTTYGDVVNLVLTHKGIDEAKLKKCFEEALEWLQT